MKVTIVNLAEARFNNHHHGRGVYATARVKTLASRRSSWATARDGHRRQEHPRGYARSLPLASPPSAQPSWSLMPFMSYQASPEEAVNAGYLRQGRAEAVKRGRAEHRCAGAAIVDGIGRGHVGLTPQSVPRWSKVQGVTGRSAACSRTHAIVEAEAYVVVLRTSLGGGQITGSLPVDHRDRRWRRLRRASLGLHRPAGHEPVVSTQIVRPSWTVMVRAVEIRSAVRRSFPSAEKSFSSPAAGGRQAVGDKVTGSVVCPQGQRLAGEGKGSRIARHRDTSTGGRAVTARS